MLRLTCVASSMLLFTACCVRAADVPPPAAPAPPAVLHAADPEFAVARIDKDGMVVIHTLRRVPKSELHTVQHTKDGATFEESVIVTNMVPEARDDHFNVKDLQATDTEGKKIDPQTLADRLKEDTVVLVSTDGQPVDPRFLAAVREGTVVLVPPVTHADANPGPKTPVEKR